MDDINALFESLQREYLSKLPEKMRRIQELFDALRADPSRMDLLEQLGTLVHKIRGNAGSYGLNELSHMAATLDNELQALLDRGKVTASELDHAAIDLDLLKQLGAKITEDSQSG